MAVTGFARPETLIYNSGGHENDVLILTKPLGTGILSTALKRDLLTKNQTAELYHTMRKLNKYAIEIIRTFPVHACTDITGFGLLGHLHEVCHASKLDAIVELTGIRFIDGAIDLAAQGMISGGTLNNKTHYRKYVTWDDAVSEPLRNLLFDGQTSGGLLCSLPPSRADECLKTLINANIPAFPIGRLIPGSGEKIFVKN
jgi:selenide,water dikinase